MLRAAINPVEAFGSTMMTTRQRSTGGAGSRSADRLDRREAQYCEEHSAEELHPERPPGRKCVLVVEDNPLNMKLFRALLETQSYGTLSANEGAAGLELAREHDPDLIIMDVELPDASGIDIIRALKADDRTRHIPVVAITASMPQEEARIRAVGGDGFMTKPIATAGFLSLVRSFLEDDLAD
ncbi:MAG TPA: response regulator [Stellaceae bacterium]